MKLFVAKRDDWNWDEYDGFVIRAEDEADARRRAVNAEPATRKKPDVWKIKEVPVDGRAGCILKSMVRG